MELKFVNVFFALCTLASLTSMPIAKAMDNNDCYSDYFEKVGLPVKPLKITVNDKITTVGDDLTKNSLSEFNDFQNNYQKLQYTFENELTEYRIIKSYILEVLKISCNELYQFDASISKPGNIPPHMKRMLAVPLDTLVSVLSTKTSIPVNLSELENYLKQSKENLKITESFDPLKCAEEFFKQKKHPSSMSLQLKKGSDVSTVFADQNRNFLTGLPLSMDPIITNRFRAFDRFIICRQLDCFLKEEKTHPELYRHSLVTFKDGLLYQDGNVLNTADAIWSLNPYGDLCIFPGKSTLFEGIHHSFFFQKDNIGLPLACGGHINVSNGKISKITNVSGHYEPSILQLILSISYFHEKEVVAKDLTMDTFTPCPNLTLNNILSIADMIIQLAD